MNIKNSTDKLTIESKTFVKSKNINNFTLWNFDNSLIDNKIKDYVNYCIV